MNGVTQCPCDTAHTSKGSFSEIAPNLQGVDRSHGPAEQATSFLGDGGDYWGYASAFSAGSSSAAASPDANISLPPPIWPARFHALFTEYTHDMEPWSSGAYNNGSFHYDYARRRQLWSHGKGQTNNWCQCAGLKTDSQCDLYSVSVNGTSGMFAVHADEGHCCKIGDWGFGFGPIRPDWLVLSNSTFLGNKTMPDGRVCPMWASGTVGDWFMMVSDNWSQDAEGTPCLYEDQFKTIPHGLGMRHTLTFDAASYSTGAEDDATFTIPPSVVDACQQTCPNKEGWCSA